MDTAQKLRDIEEAMLRATAPRAKSTDVTGGRSKHVADPAAPEPIAIIGLSGFLPGCSSVDEFWQALDGDASLITQSPPGRLGQDHPDNAPGQPIWGGFLPDI